LQKSKVTILIDSFSTTQAKFMLKVNSK